MKLGTYLYGLATVIAGILDLVWGQSENSHQPLQALGNNIPGLHLLAYIIGVWLVAAGLAVLWPRTAQIGAAASALIYLIFALLWLPRSAAAIHVMGLRLGVVILLLGGIAQELLLVAPAAIIYASTLSSDSVWKERAGIAARWMLGLAPVAFGLGHLLNSQTLARFVPHWIAFPVFWAVVTGIAFFLAGCAICSGIQDILAARLLALMLFLFEFIVEIPPVFAQPHSQGAWGGAVYNIGAVGAYWMFIEFVASRRTAHQPVEPERHYSSTPQLRAERRPV